MNRDQERLADELFKTSQKLHRLCQDVQEKLDQSRMLFDEITTRLHHRLVLIHPFSNGNGRHARIHTDILLVNHQQARFTWGQCNLINRTQTRKTYIRALREADKDNFIPFFDFVRGKLKKSQNKR